MVTEVRAARRDCRDVGLAALDGAMVRREATSCGKHGTARISRLFQVARHCSCSNFFACFSNGWGSRTLEIEACSVAAFYRR